MTNDNLKDHMLTVREVSLLLHVHPNTLRRWADKGIIKSFYISPRGDRRFMSRDINQFLAEIKAQNHPSTTKTSISSFTINQDID